MKVLVTGAAGHLGAEMLKVFSATHDVVSFTRATLDVTDAAAVHAAVRATRPDAVINCAAYNDVDGAEDNPVTAGNEPLHQVQNLRRPADAEPCIGRERFVHGELAAQFGHALCDVGGEIGESQSTPPRNCERSEAIESRDVALDCCVATLIAMTNFCKVVIPARPPQAARAAHRPIA